MITALDIRNFRAFKKVRLPNLGRVNLILGANDTGKTCLLEGMILLLGQGNMLSALPHVLRNSQGNSDDDRENFWNWLFYDRNQSNPIHIRATLEGEAFLDVDSGMTEENGHQGGKQVPAVFRTGSSGNGRELVVRFDSSSVGTYAHDSGQEPRIAVMSVRPASPVEDAEKFNEAALEAGGERRFEEIMRTIDPRLERLRYAKLPRTSHPLVYVDLGLSRAIPATQMGEAFGRIFHIYTEILVSKANVLLVDEIENGIYHKVMPTVWQGLFRAVREANIQVFATTHSWECVLAADQAARDSKIYDLSLIRLDRVEGDVKATVMDANTLTTAKELNWELR